MKTDMKTRFVLVFVMGILPLCWLTPPAWPASCDPEFGPPVPADYSTPLSDAAPPRDLAKTAEVILISGYMVASSSAKSTVTEGKGTIVHVTVDRPGAKVLLVLTSSIWTVHWQVTVTEGTALAGILVSGDKEPVVSTNVSVPAFRVRLPYVKKTESKKFVLLLKELNRLVGVAKVDAIRAGETIPTEITIAGLDAPRPELTNGLSVLQKQTFIMCSEAERWGQYRVYHQYPRGKAPYYFSPMCSEAERWGQCRVRNSGGLKA